MSLSSLENRRGRPEHEEKYGSGTIIVPPGYTRANVHSSLAAMFSESSPSNDGDTNVVQSSADGEPLSDANRQALFASLQESLRRPENCEGASSQWSVIEEALLRNPGMMRNLKRLQDNGAQLVVTKFQEGQYVEFADAAVNLDVAKQEEALADMTQQEKDDAIEKILLPLPDDQKEPAKKSILLQLNRSNDERGLNCGEALLYAVHHDGRLIAYEELDAMAGRDSSVVENRTWTWYFEELLQVMESRFAPVGYRGRGKARRHESAADLRSVLRGVRVAGLMVQIS